MFIQAAKIEPSNAEIRKQLEIVRYLFSVVTYMIYKTWMLFVSHSYCTSLSFKSLCISCSSVFVSVEAKMGWGEEKTEEPIRWNIWENVILQRYIYFYRSCWLVHCFIEHLFLNYFKSREAGSQTYPRYLQVSSSFHEHQNWRRGSSAGRVRSIQRHCAKNCRQL